MLLGLVSELPRRLSVQGGPGDQTGAARLRGEFGEGFLPNTTIATASRVGVNDGPRSGTGPLERKSQMRPPTRRISIPQDPRLESEPLSRREGDAGMPPGCVVSGLAAQFQFPPGVVRE